MYRNLRNHAAVILTLIVASMAFAGCKPTEKNYKAAYEAARDKRAAMLHSYDLSSPLQDDETISIKLIDGDSVWVSHERLELRPAEGDSVPDMHYGVAFSTFKMPTNACAQAADLRAAGHRSYPATDGRGKWYVVADLYPNLPQAAAAAAKFRCENPTYIYVGLPAPVVVNLR
ncbi:MAG: hypothetical protein NC097_04020 [Clostridium sp.]|nr:hypothetical protein [Prevotella sp.]MCM1378123.1 hypothetical protein [Prevotella sp.]MCM1428943.1 hypothetical protein [Clostridium sp.]MCM1475977.1 hypothetical protein [Muribaculaceae bacterium]